jgi:aryl-alcohol dehydrogenase-like predicted oxidoreductase
MDYVDLLQIHRWDYNTPIEETLEALDEVVKAGKARYIGASSMHARQFARRWRSSSSTAGRAFVTMQDHYNLIYREEENEMLPLCQQRRGGDPVESAGARRLTRPWGETTARLVSDEWANRCTAPAKKTCADCRESADVAEETAPAAQVALAWLLSKPGVAAPIIGASRQEQLDELLQAVDLTLPGTDRQAGAPYQPHPVVGFK